MQCSCIIVNGSVFPLPPFLERKEEYILLPLPSGKCQCQRTELNLQPYLFWQIQDFYTDFTLSSAAGSSKSFRGLLASVR